MQLGRRRLQRSLFDQLGFLERADEGACIGRFAAQRQLTRGVLAAKRRPHFQLSDPRIVGKEPGNVVDDLDRAGVGIFFCQHVVVVALLSFEQYAQPVGYLRLLARALHLLVERNGVLALLKQWHE